MRLSLFVACFVIPLAIAKHNYEGADFDDNEFAEFEDFDDDEFESIPTKQKSQKTEKQEEKKQATPDSFDFEDDGVVEDEVDEDIEHLTDEDEFEGFDPDYSSSKRSSPDLVINEVPVRFSTNWDSYHLELLMVAGLVVYFINLMAGRAKNSKLANAWLNANREYLVSQFALVGDDGVSPDMTHNALTKDTDSVYNLWCSGRVCCEGMLVTLKLLKRQDLVSSIAQFFSPKFDQVLIKMTMEEGKESLDNFVFCVANRKVIGKLHKEVQDLNWFCQEKKQVDKQRLSQNYQVLNEIGEVSAAILDGKVCTCLNKFENQVDYIHISDHYCGLKSMDDSQPTAMPQTERVLIFCFNVHGGSKATTSDFENMKELLQLVFYLTEKVRKFRLSREARVKSEKNRVKVQEFFQKQAHTQRAEAAQLRKEEKRRAEKDKIMAEEDPEKQRRMEEKSQKKEKNSKKPKMRMVKTKVM